MGRIADALRRAEQERRQARVSLGSGGDDATVSSGPATMVESPGPSPPAAEEDEQANAPITLVQGLCDALVPYYERSSLVTEQYRSLRTRLLSQNPYYEHRTLAITSAVPKEGKSVTTLNLGCTLAEIRHLKVLVVDGDFRRGSLAQMLNQGVSPGLADVLSGQATYQEVIHSTPIANMMFIPAGNIRRRSAAQLLTAANAKAVFHRMQTEFHYTLIDTPPATTVSDVGVIGQMCSSVIIVVRLHRTDETAAKRAVRLLQANNIPIAGCLLIGRDTPGTWYGYGYGYGYGYNYYRDYDNYHNKKNENES